MPESVTYVPVPEVHMHDQQRTQPLETIETLSTAPLVLGISGYLVARRAYFAVLRLRE